MDTKSKSTKYSYSLKIAAVCFIIIFALIAGFYGGQVVKTISLYGQTRLSTLDELTNGSLNVSETGAFKSQVLTDLNTVANASGIIEWTNFLNNKKYYSKEEVVSKTITAFLDFKAESLKEAKQQYQQYNSKYEEPTSSEHDTAVATTKYNGNSNITLDDYDKNYYENQNETYHMPIGGSITFKTTLTEKEVEALASERYDSTIADAKRAHEMSLTTNKRDVEKFKNFKFFIVSSDGQKVHSNLGDNVKDISSAKDALSKNDFFVFYTADRGLIDSSGLSDSDYTNIINSTRTNSNAYSSYSSLGETIITQFINNGYDVYISVENPLQEGDNYYTINENFKLSAENTSDQLIIVGVCLFLIFMLSVYLVLVTGHVAGVEGIKMSFIDRVPTDLHLITSIGIIATAIALAFAVASEMMYSINAPYAHTVYIWMLSVLFMGFYVVCLEIVTSIARYVKSKSSWLRRTSIFMVLRWVKNLFKRFGSKIAKPIKKSFKALKYKPKKIKNVVFMFAFVFLVVNFILFFFLSTITFIFLLPLIIIFNLAIYIIIRKYLISLDKIIDCSERDENGEMKPIYDIELMPEPLKTLGNNLSFTQDEMKKAVDEAIKGEKMKTELITNVSHDLKTPLTSIISYVDLLKKCDIDDISATKYIDVLDEKSIRLKRLIEDLVEASKASSGAITFNKMKVNLYELLVQAVGEMDDMFESAKLSVILADTDNPPLVFADSQKTWRIIDNLLSNAKKYSLEGTRIYIDTSTDGRFGIITIKNTSRDSLNIDPQELTERFVRGDSSRSREGSGLGLSIAKDLCVLQGGIMDISIDGDLFKVTVKMPLYN